MSSTAAAAAAGGAAASSGRSESQPWLWLSRRGPFMLKYQKQADRRKVSALMQREDEKLVKTVTAALPGGNAVSGADVNAVSDQLLDESESRKVTWSLARLRNWTSG